MIHAKSHRSPHKRNYSKRKKKKIKASKEVETNKHQNNCV